MPCYLFSWHAYGAWGGEPTPPIAPGGQRLLPDRVVADRYRERTADPAACLDDAAQRTLIERLQASARDAGVRLHAAATDPGSVQAVLSWGDSRPEGQVRRDLHDALSAALATPQRRVWLSHRGRRRRIADRADFEDVAARTLRRQPGWRWDERRGWMR